MDISINGVGQSSLIAMLSERLQGVEKIELDRGALVLDEKSWVHVTYALARDLTWDVEVQPRLVGEFLGRITFEGGEEAEAWSAEMIVVRTRESDMPPLVFVPTWTAIEAGTAGITEGMGITLIYLGKEQRKGGFTAHSVWVEQY